MKNKLQRVLLVGAGRFGRNYLRVLNDMHKNKIIDFVGIVVKSEATVKRLANETSIKISTELSDTILSQTDVVIITTPPETHYELARRCLNFCDVFVEKPLALNVEEINNLDKLSLSTKHVLAVGHIFRFHPVTKKLIELGARYGKPQSISGSFINDLESDQGRNIALELLHLFDIIDAVWEPKVSVVSCVPLEERLQRVDIRYENFCDAQLMLGWSGDTKIRSLICIYDQMKLVANFELGKIEIFENKNIKDVTRIVCAGEEPLNVEIKSFLKRDNSIIGAKTASKIVAIANKSVPNKTRKPKVAIIGAGMFGLNTAFTLDNFCDVTIFERNDQILSEGARVNQFRHHAGYHYPRSDETVKDVQQSHKIFESLYKEALVEDVPTYYAIANTGSHTNSEDFLAFCKRNALPYKIVNDHPFDRNSVAFVVEVVEPSYHFEILKDIHQKSIDNLINTQLKLDSEIVGANLCANGSKELVVRNKRGEEKYTGFDFVINTTYANTNYFTKMLGFKPVPIRVDLAEVLILSIPIAPVSLTVIDGPFATLMPTGNKNEFTLYHVTESILDRYTPEDGLIIRNEQEYSNSERIFNESLIYFPQLNQAKVVESRIVYRGVHAHHEHDDNRVAEIFEHGFGCISVLSGKIVSSVKIANEISVILRNWSGDYSKS